MSRSFLNTCSLVLPTGWALRLGAVLLAWAAVGGAPQVAQAGARDSEMTAELVRLEEDLRKLASRNAWEGVDGAYSRMRSLEAKGASLTMEQHELGAEAALQLGHILEARGRFGLARNATTQPGEKQRLQGIIGDIDRRFGPVELVAAGRVRRDATVRMGSAVFAHDARKAIEYANAEIQLSGKFEGLLPVGSYTFGLASFVVATDAGLTRADAALAAGAEVAVADAPAESKPEPKPKPKPEPKAKPERTPKEKPARAERSPAPEKRSPDPAGTADGQPAVYVGAGVGSATWASMSDVAGYYVPAGTGLGARVHGGMAFPVGPVSLLADVGWDGSFGSGGQQATVHLATVGTGLSFGTVVQGRVLGQVGLGRSSVTGIDGAAACQTPEWTGSSAAAQATCGASPHWGTTGVQYSVLSPGGLVGVAIAPESLGGVAIAADVGLRGLNGQLQPWTALGARYSFGSGGAQ